MKGKNKSIFSSLIKNYILFILTLIVLFIITAFFTQWQLGSSVENGKFPKIRASDVVRPDYENINIKDIEGLDGWVEILDENRNVIYVKGNKKDEKQSYTQEEIFNLVGVDCSEKYFGLIQSFKSKEGKTYYCLVKYPDDKLKVQVNMPGAPYRVTKMYYDSMLKAILLFIVLFIINVIFYSLWTSKKIRIPLKKITEGISRMSDGHLDTKLEFKAEKEFAVIRDSFNFMAEKLKDSEKEKRELEENKIRMLLDLSHDIKTPITTVQGYSKALSENLIDNEDKKQRYYKTIYAKAARVNELVNDLFEFVTLESTDYCISKTNEDFLEFLRKIMVEYYDEIEEKEFDLDLRIPDKEIILNFDTKLMSRAISNIIVNDLKYNPKGTKLRIEIIEGETEIVLEIADNGIGIPEPLREKIFCAFVRGDESRKSDGGTGLGLAIAKKIIERHGGELKLSIGNCGEVTKFKITLPLS